MKIDVYAHIIPPNIKDFVFKRGFSLAEIIKPTPPVYDLDTRFRIMDKYTDLVQVLTLSGVSIDDLAGPGEAVDLAKRVNDEMAELIYKYPDRFVAGVAVLPMSDIDAALTEVDRAINELKLRGVLIRIPINGKPVDRTEFMPLYDKMCKCNLPIFWHPQRDSKIPDYVDEEESKYYVWRLWGLPIETTISMTRLILSGTLEKYPKLKIITHHCGGMVPYFSQRIVNSFYRRGMHSKANYTVGLTEPPVEYFRRFYADTAIVGNTPALMCAYSFFGPEHLLFGTDAPFDTQFGDFKIRNTIQAIEQMDIPDTDKKMIFEDNARKLMCLPI